MSCQGGTVSAWWVGNSMLVQLGTLIALGDLTDEPLTDELTGTVITDATVTARLLDVAGAEVAGETWPLALAHISGGVYRAIASSAVAVVAGVAYTLEVMAVKAGVTSVWQVPVPGEVRTG